MVTYDFTLHLRNMWPHYMILEVRWDGLWTLSFGLSQFHGHGSWLVCEVAVIHNQHYIHILYKLVTNLQMYDRGTWVCNEIPAIRWYGIDFKVRRANITFFYQAKHVLTLFRYITMFCGTDNILWNIPHIHSKWTWELFYNNLLVPQNIVMDRNNVMIWQAQDRNLIHF